MLSRRCLVAGALSLLATIAGCASAPPQADAPRVLLFGGTGQLGADVARRLVDTGARVTVFARANADRSRLAGLQVDYVIGDLLDAGSVDAALRARRYDAVVIAVRVEDGDTRFYQKIMPPIVAGASVTGVRHILHHGAVGAGSNADRFPSLGWEKVPGLLERLKDQGVGEDILRAGGVPYTIIRNSRIYPDGTPSTGRAELTEDDSVLTPMTRADLAIFTRDCLLQPRCFGKTYHVRDPSLRWPPPATAPPRT